MYTYCKSLNLKIKITLILICSLTIKNNFIVFMKNLYCSFSIRVFAINYSKALQVGSVEGDLFYLNALFSKYTINMLINMKIYLYLM